MWQKNRPSSEDEIKSIPSILRDNWSAIEDILGVEHYTLTSAASGKHIPGKVSVVYEGTTAQINALTSVPSGAWAYDTTIGYLKRYTGASWVVETATHSRVRAYKSTTTSATTGSSIATSGDWVVFNTEVYDELSEYNNTTGVFTAAMRGYYLVTASVSVCASGPVLATQAAASATSTDVGNWDDAVPAQIPANHHLNIDEYPTASDADYVTTQTSGDYDQYSHSREGSSPIPSSSSSINVTVAFRARARGCVCDSTCYSQTCTCDTVCYVHGCTCNSTCYGYSACSCNMTCYEYAKSCTCNSTCYEYSACSCNATCYSQSCTCNATGYGSGGSCGCYNTGYQQGAVDIAPFIRRNATNYFGDYVRPSLGSFTAYSKVWSQDPATGIAWTTSGASAIEAFGMRALTASTTGCSGDVSQIYMLLNWFPLQPVYVLRLYKNNVENEIVYAPIKEAGTASNQTINANTLVYLDTGDTLRVAFVKVSNVADNIIGTTEGTYFTIHRIEGQCV